jgi:sterol desaturase/sphingolipid hydroxylase (fatty acid hydroxylase superfamily)
MNRRLIGQAAMAAALIAIVVGERARPLRGRVEAPWRRDLRNLGVAVLAGAAVRLVERPLADSAARWAAGRRWGLHRTPWPAWAKTVAAVLWLDYGLYVWHVLEHREPLWRLHRAHHSDLEVSASTALRLHFTEMALSGPWRAAQVALVGVSSGQLALWRNITLVAIVFHHANLWLPERFERSLARVLMTPRQHGTHHSTVPDEVDSNWSTIFSWWDQLHGTQRLDRPQREDGLGVPDKRNPRQVTLPRVLGLPFERRDQSLRTASRMASLAPPTAF